MKSLITENEKLRIRSMHISERLSLLKEDDTVFADLLPIPQGTAAVEVVSTTVTAGEPKTGTPEAKAFHDWLDANKEDWNTTNQKLNWKKLNKGRSYGIFGPKSKAAWAQFKDEYTKTLK